MALGIAGQKFSAKAMLYEVMPYLPAQHYQKMGQMYLRTTSCMMPRLTPPLACTEGANHDMWVAAAAQKSAAVMTAMISVDIAAACGKCVGVGDRPNGDWPNPVEAPPPYQSDLLLAIANMPSWPEYVEKLGAPVAGVKEGDRRSRCIVTVRHPVARLVSTFFYAKEGRETWFREHGVALEINRLIAKDTEGKQGEGLEDVSRAVAFMLDRFGLEYVLSTHEYLLQNVKLGCTVIRYESLVADFEGSMAEWFDAWGVTRDQDVRAQLLKLAANNSPARQTSDNHHATGSLYSQKFKESVKSAFLANATLAALVDKQSNELGYVS